MRQGSSRSSSLTVPRTTVQRSTSRSSQSTVPRTTARTSTLSAEQQRLWEVAACLPMWYLYGNEHPVHLLYPGVAALREEYQPANNASSPGQSDDNPSSSSFLPEVPTSTCRPCEQPFNGPLHQNILQYPNFKCGTNLNFLLWTYICKIHPVIYNNLWPQDAPTPTPARRHLE